MNKIFTIILACFLFAGAAMATIRQTSSNEAVVETEGQVVYIVNGKTSTGAGDSFIVYPGKRTFHATVSGTGAVTATVKIQVSNDGTTWVDATLSPHIALSGTTSDSDGFTMEAKWAFVRAYVDAIGGTSAKVTVTMGV